jgi:glycosyltransferase involved in cell wall biosynthesis
MQDDRLFVIDRAENKGLAYSFNESLKNARGKYICYLGDDDLFYRDHIATLVNALENNPEYQVAYTDLYKVHYKLDKQGKRVAYSKNIEVNRDFDRMSLFRYNNQLHVSLMHRRDILEKTGVYREDVTCLLDWDLNRRMCFFTDFLHIHRITGEYYDSFNGKKEGYDADIRMSSRERQNPPAYIRNFLNIRHYRPEKPWPKVHDLSILIPMVEFDKVINRTLRLIHLFTFYPHQVFVTCRYKDIHKIKTTHPNVLIVPTTDEKDINQLIAMLHKESPNGIKTVIKPDHPIGENTTPWIEGFVNKELERIRNA